MGTQLSPYKLVIPRGTGPSSVVACLTFSQIGQHANPLRARVIEFCIPLRSMPSLVDSDRTEVLLATVGCLLKIMYRGSELYGRT